MATNDMTRDDVGLFEQVIQRSGFELVHTWQESHGLQTDRIYQRPHRPRTSDLPSAGEEIVITERIAGYGGPVGYSFRISAAPGHDYLLAAAILRDVEANPDEWVQRDRRIEPCCTASSGRYERDSGRDRESYTVVCVAGHGVWAYKNPEGR